MCSCIDVEIDDFEEFIDVLFLDIEDNLNYELDNSLIDV